MKRISLILNSIALLSLLTIASCGSDNSLSGKSTTSGSNSLTGGNCAATATYSPVCGSNSITYDNIEIAKCYGVTQTVQGNCICTEKPVCGDDGKTYTECEAQAAIRNGFIKKITKFADCRAATY